MKTSRSDIYHAAALLIAVTAAFALLRPDALVNTRGGGDSPFLLQRVHQLTTALRDGHFPVRWMPDANYGLGYPFFNYYAPLSIYIASLFRLLGLTTVTAIQLSQLAGFLAAAAGMYRLVLHWHQSRGAALLASVAYTLAPFHMVNVYVRGDSLAEFWAMALYPWVFLTVDAAFDRPVRAGHWAWFGVAYAALVLSHNISALIFSPFLGLWMLWRVALAKDKGAAVVRGGLGLGLGLALSAWFWWPALREQALAQLGPVTEGYFSYSQHFRGLDLIQPRLFFDYSVAVASDPFRMGLVQTVVIGLGVIGSLWVVRRSGNRPIFIFTLIGLLIATLMITPFSEILWERLPLLPFVQFPWRFLSVQAFFGALICGALGTRPRLLIPALSILLLAALGNLRPDRIIVPEDAVSAAHLADYEWFSGNVGTTISAEYLPHTVQPRQWSSTWLATGERDTVSVTDGFASAQLIERKTHVQLWQVDVASESATILLPTMMWPGWTAEIDGESAEIDAAPSSGQMQLTIAQGTHDVTLRLTRTTARVVSEAISLVAALVTIGLLLSLFREWSLRRWALPALVIVCAALLLTLWPSQTSGPATWDFDQQAYLYPSPSGVPFSNGARLLDYDYVSSTVAGEPLTLMLEWQGAPQRAIVRLTTSAANRYATLPPIVEQAIVLEAGRNALTLPIAANAPVGRVIPQLVLDDAVALTSTGEPRGTLALRPLQLMGAARGEDSAEFPIELRVDQFSQQADGALNLQLAGRIAEPLPQNYKMVVRLLDSRNLFYAQHDTQPGYELRPTSSWPANTWINDWLTLDWVADDGVGPYTLVASLYDAASGETAYTRHLGTLTGDRLALGFNPTTPSFEIPAGIELVDVMFGDVIGLRGYRVEQDSAENEATITLAWESLAPESRNLTRFVHLVDVVTGDIVTQSDAVPQNGLYPVNQWTVREIVTERVQLDLTNVPAGDYELRIGWYDDPAAPRLTVRNAAGQPLPDDLLRLPFTR